MDRQALGTSEVIRANSRNLPLADNSVDLVVTSPPYFALRSYQDGGEHYAGQIGDEPTPAQFINSLLQVTFECRRVLKPSGSLWVNLGDKYDQNKSLLGLPWWYALRCMDELGLILRSEVIWSKPNGLPESVTDRVRRAHEQWFHFTLQPHYFSAVDEIREEHATVVTPSGAVRYRRPGEEVVPRPKTVTKSDRRLAAPSGRREGETMQRAAGSPQNPLGRLPGSVWTIPTEPLKVPAHLGVDHFAAFPTEWPRRIISAWCPDGGTVLDPFGGTGTTALVAKALGRHGISVDMSADYCRLAEWRTNDPKQLAKAARKPFVASEAPMDGQGDLLSLLNGEVAS